MPRLPPRKARRGRQPRPSAAAWPKPCRPSHSLRRHCVQRVIASNPASLKPGSGKNARPVPQRGSNRCAPVWPKPRPNSRVWLRGRKRSPHSAMRLPTGWRRPKPCASRPLTRFASLKPRWPKRKRRSARPMPALPRVARHRYGPKARANAPRKPAVCFSLRSRRSSDAGRTDSPRLPRPRMPQRLVT